MEVDRIIHVPTTRVNLYVSECCACGTVFGVDNRLDDMRRDDGKNIYCPNGHGQSYRETEASRLKKQLEEEQAKLANAQFELMTLEKKLKRTENRIKNGVCPCCYRQFVQLTRHMKTKHPDFGGVS